MSITGFQLTWCIYPSSTFVLLPTCILIKGLSPRCLRQNHVYSHGCELPVRSCKVSSSHCNGALRAWFGALPSSNEYESRISWKKGCKWVVKLKTIYLPRHVLWSDINLYPVQQEQKKDPSVFVQFCEQTFGVTTHSLTSKHRWIDTNVWCHHTLIDI